MKILVATQKPFAKAATDGIAKIAAENGHTVTLLEKYEGEGVLLKAVADADALIVRSDKVTEAVVEAAPKLKIVVRAGAGFDNLDLAACSSHKVVAMNTPGQNSNAVAELALGLMVYMNRNQFTPGTGRELKGRIIGIQAYGNVGRLVGALAMGFGMNVLAFDPFLTADKIESTGAKVASSLEELYSKSDFVSLHIPATEQTKGSIGYDLVSRMPKGGCLVNTARKEVIDEEGLIKILSEREDLRYVADVAPDRAAEFAEKFGARYFATPKKMGAETAEANVNAGLAAASQICRFFSTGDTTFQLNRF